MGNFFEFVVAFSSAIGGLLFGYEIGIIDQVLQMHDFGFKYDLLDPTRTDDNGQPLATAQHADVTGNITSSFLIGCVFGSIAVSFLADILGRKRSILIGGFLFAAGGALQAGALNFILFIVGRVISGLGVGILSMCVPVYISETAPQQIRGRLIAVQQLMITIGILVAALVNIAIRSNFHGLEIEWRLALSLQCVPGVLLLIMMAFMPYSPRWLQSKDRSDDAIAALSRLRAANPNSATVRQEYEEIKDGIEFERSIGNASFSELFKPGIRNRIAIALVLQTFQQWTGINVILYYASSLFKEMGFDPDVATMRLNVAAAVVNVLGTFPGMYLVERLGRRKLLFLGGLGMGVSHFMVTTFISLSKSGNPLLAWGAVIFIFLFLLSFASTWGPIVWVYQSEIFPLRIRAKGTGLATFANWTMNAVIAKATPIFQQTIGHYLYIIFGCTGILMSGFTFFFVPETMGKSLEDMDELFGVPRNNRSAADREREAMYAKKMAVGGH